MRDREHTLGGHDTSGTRPARPADPTRPPARDATIPGPARPQEPLRIVSAHPPPSLFTPQHARCTAGMSCGESGCSNFWWFASPPFASMLDPSGPALAPLAPAPFPDRPFGLAQPQLAEAAALDPPLLAADAPSPLDTLSLWPVVSGGISLLL
eukprot:6269590-Prymnesium_polylepis.1